ncbi:hypothetical protein [Nitratifractor sp.]
MIKILLLGIGFLLLPLQAELDAKKIEMMVKQIQNKRTSQRKIDFDNIPSPFVVIVPRDENRSAQIVTPEDVVTFTLAAIVNGKAHINGRWVREGDTIQGFKVEQVGDGEVVLKKEDREIHLFLPNPKEKNLLQISEG